MNFGTALVGIILLMAFIVPLIIINLQKNKKEKQFLSVLKNLAKSCHCEISQYDTWNSCIIGLDNNSHKLFFIKFSNGTETSTQVDLNQILKCEINSYKSSLDNGGVLEKLILSFIISKDKLPSTRLEFYNADNDSLTLSGELQIAEKWLKIVNDEVELCKAQRVPNFS